LRPSPGEDAADGEQRTEQAEFGSCHCVSSVYRGWNGWSD
jgi:hypothetical protein